MASGVAGQAGVEGPGGCAPGRPVPAQVIGGLADVVGNDPGMGGFPGPAHGHIGQLSSPAVGEEVSPCSRRTLGTVDRCGVPVGRAGRRRLLAAEAHLAPVVGAEDERTAGEVDALRPWPARR